MDDPVNHHPAAQAHAQELPGTVCPQDLCGLSWLHQMMLPPKQKPNSKLGSEQVCWGNDKDDLLCVLLGTSWSEEKVKQHISQGLQVLGGRRKGFLFSILSRTCQHIRVSNFPPGRSHKTFSLPSISSARIATCSASPNVAHSCLWCVKTLMMLKTREMWLVMLCWRLGVVQGKDHFILFLLLPSLKTNIDTGHWG